VDQGLGADLEENLDLRGSLHDLYDALAEALVYDAVAHPVGVTGTEGSAGA
jgi:hypothetical protein